MPSSRIPPKPTPHPLHPIHSLHPAHPTDPATGLALLMQGLDNLDDQQRAQLEAWLLLYSIEQSAKALGDEDRRGA